MAYSSHPRSNSSDSNRRASRANGRVSDAYSSSGHVRASRGQRSAAPASGSNNPRVGASRPTSTQGSRSRVASEPASSASSRHIPRAASSRPRASQETSRRSASTSQTRPSSRSDRPSSSRVSSVRIGDIGRAERAKVQAEKQARSRKRFLIVAAIVVVALLVVIAGLALSRSSAFTIKNVEVKGSTHLTQSEMEVLAPVPEGTTLLDVDTAALEKSIERDAWVEDAVVSRSFPSTLVITIAERDIGAIVEIATGDSNTFQAWAIADDGMWLMAIPNRESEIGQAISPAIYEDAENALLITDVPYGLVPEMGTYCSDGNVNNALAIVNGMTTELADQVKTVSATDAESTLLTLENGIEIAFGAAEDIRDKERICLEIMEQNPGAVAYINVRVVDAPTWRAV